jgi:hypothetical protein
MDSGTPSLTLTIVESISPDLYKEMLSIEGATIYHTSAWHRFLTRTFGWRVHAIAVRDSRSRLVWCLPFVRKRRLGFKRVNVCLPLSNRIGPVQQKEVLLEALPSLPKSVQPIEIHERVSMPRMHHMVRHYVTELDLTKYESLEELKRSFHKDSIQRKINKAEKCGLKLIKSTAGCDFDIFQMLQTETRRRQGSPMYPRHFFRNMWEELRADDLVHLHLAYMNGRPVSGIIFLHFRDTAAYGYGASVNNREVWQLGANQLTMWSAIRDAYEKGLARVDFGTSPISQPELRAYKEKWSAKSCELAYTIVTDGETHLQVDRSGQAVKTISWMLQHLPERVFNWISPTILRAVV